MRAKIKEIDVFSRREGDDIVTVYRTYYTSGTCRDYKSGYAYSYPESVSKYIDEHEGKRANSQCVVYKD